MEEARKVLERLGRIEALEQERAHPAAMLAELRALVSEAEAWVRVERAGDEALEAVEKCERALAGSVVPPR